MSTATVTLERGTHTYVAGDGQRVPLCVSDVLSLSGIVQPYPPSAMNFVEHARELGETVHEWCAYLDSGEDADGVIDSLRDSEPLPYVLAYQRFRKRHYAAWECIEQPFVDAELGVAGTPDRIGSIDIEPDGIHPALIDIKTPKSKADHWGLQLSGYQHLSRRSECLLFVLHLCSDATFKLRPYPSDIETFLAAVKVAKWRLEHGGKIR